MKPTLKPTLISLEDFFKFGGEDIELFSEKEIIAIKNEQIIQGISASYYRSGGIIFSVYRMDDNNPLPLIVGMFNNNTPVIDKWRFGYVSDDASIRLFFSGKSIMTGKKQAVEMAQDLTLTHPGLKIFADNH